MPRDLPLGNGQMLVCFDQHYRIRDLYYPHIGQEEHCGDGGTRLGVFADLPEAGNGSSQHERRRRRLYWTDQDWQIDLDYEPNTLVTRVKLAHDPLKLALHCQDVLDFHRPILVKRIEVENLGQKPRDIRLVHHHDFHIFGTKVGDTVYYDPQLRSLVHYRTDRYLMATWCVDGEQWIDEYACGTAGFGHAEGTWRDAEDGTLSGNSIAQGSVDSTMLVRLQVAPDSRRVVYLVIGAGRNYKDLEGLQQFLHREGPQGVIERTRAYWRLWLDAGTLKFKDAIPSKEKQHLALSERTQQLYERSLLIVRTQIDNNGSIIAANDTDYLQYSRDTYSYNWPRDGALVASALDEAGFGDVARNFYSHCAQIINPRGCFFHKYNPDGTQASSWHPWISLGRPQLPIQEDETALVIWALWRHYRQYRDIEFVRPLWMRLIQPAGDFMVRFRDPLTNLPLPCYDLWEERWGVNAFTVGSVYGGLSAAWRFATCFGDTRRAKVYAEAAEKMKQAFLDIMWSNQHNRFLRRVVPLDHDRTARLMADILDDREPKDDMPVELGEKSDAAGKKTKGKKGVYEPPIDLELDAGIDSSLMGVYAFGMLEADDPRVIKTMRTVENRLWVRTPVGGLARYEGDGYHKVSDDQNNVPGNPWFISTLWLAQWMIDRARSARELSKPRGLIEWAGEHALRSCVLAEQVHPYTGGPLSVSPLTWSHATLVSVVGNYVRRLAGFEGQADPEPASEAIQEIVGEE